MTQVLPDGIAAVLVLAASVVATGTLHLDGFLDACDGLFGGYTPEKRTDAVVIACTGRGEPIFYAGPATPIGWLIGRCVRQALQEVLDAYRP